MTARATLTQRLWVALWLCWLTFALQQCWDLLRFDAPPVLAVLRILPLVIFVPGVWRDNLRSVVWLCFVTLFYFISSVEAVFARPNDAVSIGGVVAIVLLFVVSTLYIRFRGREQRSA